MSAQTPLLEMQGLKIEGESQAGWSEIVSDIDLTLDRGEVLGLIGESGAGKSTLGLAAMGFTRGGCRIAGGSIRFDGTELVGLAPAARRRLLGARIAYVAQSAAAAFNPAHRLIAQCTEGPVRHRLKARPEAEQDAVDLFRRLHLPEPAQIGFRYPHQVSGGQLQRAMTAMAMSCRPDLIVFDEPTTALDVTTQIEVLAAIRDVVEQFGTAAIYITHDLAVVAQMADRIMVLRHGKLVEEAETRTMLSAPRMPYTKSLWSVRQFRKVHRPAAGGTPLLRMEGVSAGYRRDDRVLDDVTIDVPPGQTVAVVGESGSGKSTAARVITGLLTPREGQVFFEGEALPASYRQRSRDELRSIQMIYQSPDTAVNPRQRVRDIVGRPLGFYLGLRGAARERRLEELMEQIEMDPAVYLDRYPTELSGGQKQRICIARALAAEPKVIICDEVTSALDQIVAEGILKLLDRLQGELGLGYLFVTHDLATVRAIADSVVVMHEGRVVESGSVETIFTPPHDPYTALLLSSVPEMDPDWLDHVLRRRAAAAARPVRGAGPVRPAVAGSVFAREQQQSNRDGGLR